MRPNSWLTPEELHAWRALVELTGHISEGTDNDAGRFGLSGADLDVLIHLSEAGERGIRMSDLAGRVFVSKSRLTYRMDRLQERGIVTREVCRTDRRGYVARITATGLELLDQAAPHHMAGVRSRLIDRLGAEEFLVLGRLAAKAVGRVDHVSA